MKWNDKKSVLRFGARTIVEGDELSAPVLAMLGKDRVKKMKDAGQIVESQGKAPGAREVALDRAEELGIKVAKGAGTKAVQGLIKAEEVRLVLLEKARGLELKVADNASASDLQTAITGATKAPGDDKLAVAKARAKQLGLKHNSNLGIKKINALIDAEEARLVLLDKARTMKIEVADDASAKDLQKLVDAEG